MTINQIGIAHRRVLIVEDNLFIAVGLARLLRPKGVEIIGPVATVKEAWHSLVTASALIVRR